MATGPPPAGAPRTQLPPPPCTRPLLPAPQPGRRPPVRRRVAREEREQRALQHGHDPQPAAADGQERAGRAGYEDRDLVRPVGPQVEGLACRRGLDGKACACVCVCSACVCVCVYRVCVLSARACKGVGVSGAAVSWVRKRVCLCVLGRKSRGGGEFLRGDWDGTGRLHGQGIRSLQVLGLTKPSR